MVWGGGGLFSGLDCVCCTSARTCPQYTFIVTLFCTLYKSQSAAEPRMMFTHEACQA